MVNKSGGTFSVGQPSDSKFAAIANGSAVKIKSNTKDANGSFILPFTYSVGGENKSGTVNVNVTPMVDFEIAVVNSFNGQSLTGTTWKVGDKTFTADGAGILRGQVTPGLQTTYLATNPNAKPAHSIEVVPGKLEMLPRYSGIPHQVQFLRRATDTLDFKQDFATKMYMQRADEPNFSDRHFASFFDTPTLGWRIYTDDTLILHTRKSPLTIQNVEFFYNISLQVEQGWETTKQMLKEPIKGVFNLEFSSDPVNRPLASNVIYVGEYDRNGNFSLTDQTGKVAGTIAFVERSAPMASYISEAIAKAFGLYADDDCWPEMPANPLNDCGIPSLKPFEVTPNLATEVFNTAQYFGKSASKRANADRLAGTKVNYFSYRNP